jgi:hypothetical protein
MLIHLKVLPAISLIMFLGAFGNTSHAADVGAITPSSAASVTAFSATVTMAPVDGSTLVGIERLEVSGNALANVELLPASGYTPKRGIFNISADKTRAWLDLDSTTLPNGPLDFRISAFNVPAGQSGASEIIAMPARTWTVNNPASTPGTFTATLTSAPADGAVLTGITRLEVRGSRIVNVELLPASGFTPKLAVFNVSEDRTMAWLDFDSSTLPDGVKDVRISAFNVTQGQPGATEIVAMPARRWEFRNRLSFSASVTMAPINGEFLSGVVRFEVRGSGMRNVELLPATGFDPKMGTFSVSSDGTFASLDFDTRPLAIGPVDMRISAFNVPAGQPGAVEIIAMPARQWILKHFKPLP